LVASAPAMMPSMSRMRSNCLASFGTDLNSKTGQHTRRYPRDIARPLPLYIGIMMPNVNTLFTVCSEKFFRKNPDKPNVTPGNRYFWLNIGNRKGLSRRRRCKQLISARKICLQAQRNHSKANGKGDPNAGSPPPSLPCQGL
jgi:hypothetical protein